MKPEDVLAYYKSQYNFRKQTGMSNSTLGNWLMKGYIPEDAQYRLERITKGELKVMPDEAMHKDELQVKWPYIVQEYEKIYFNYINLGNYIVYRMVIFKTLLPRKGLFVAIESKGAFFFDIRKPLHKDYVAEKLCLAQSDSGSVADFLNVQLKKDRPQQGKYIHNAIMNIESFGKIGEIPIQPWTPEILDKD